MKRADTGLVFRPVRDSDEAAVLDLLSTSLGSGPTGSRTAEFFRWKHRDNPFGASPGLVAEDHGRLIGVRLFLRWQLEAAGESVKAVRAVDTATDPAYRGQGIFRRLTLDLLSQLEDAGEVDLVFNTPNANSRPGYLKMGWHSVGTLPVRIRPIHPLTLLAGARSATRTIALGSRGSRPTASRPHTLPACPFPPATVVLEHRGPEVQALLDDASSVSGLHTPLSLDFLRWRYGQAPGLDYRCILAEAQGELTGLAFGRLRRRGSLTEFTLADVIVRGTDQRNARALMRAGGHSGADHVATHVQRGTPAASVALRSGYLPIPHYGLGLVANPRRPLPVDPLDKRAWQVCLGDLEVF